MAELLDDPIWHALRTEQRHLAVANDDAARFPPELTALAAVREPTAAAFAALGALLMGRTTGVFLPGEPPLPPSMESVASAELVQMILERAPSPPTEDGVVSLGPADAAEMLALAEQAKPGPFGLRTHELGTFLGIREGGRLVAMAGQRLRLPGLVEVSGIATDPEHVGRGHAARLTAAQVTRIRATGATPFLHVRGDNTRAIALYERLGFVLRMRSRYHVVRARRP